MLCFQALGQGYLSWDNLQWNFDNVFASMHTLFTVSTLSGWAETMYACIASRGVDKQPEQFNNPVVGAYFIIAQIVCSFFTLNLIIGAVIDNFNRIRDEKNGSAFLTQRQVTSGEYFAKKKNLTTFVLSFCGREKNGYLRRLSSLSSLCPRKVNSDKEFSTSSRIPCLKDSLLFALS